MHQQRNRAILFGGNFDVLDRALDLELASLLQTQHRHAFESLTIRFAF